MKIKVSKTLNRKEITAAQNKFIIYFLILLLLGVFGVYVYLKSNEADNELSFNKLELYREKEADLQNIAESNERLMLYLKKAVSEPEQDNESLQQNIFEQKNKIISTLNKDTADFIIYRKMMKGFEELILLSDSVVKVNSRQELIKKQLIKCMRNENTIPGR